MSPAKNKFWHAKRLNRLSVVVLLGILLAAAISAVSDRTQSGLLLRGDFPAFYAAGVLLAQGKSEELYHQVAQQQIENAAWPSLEGMFYSFSYPPYVAGLFSGLAHLSPVVAKLVFTACMLLCLLGAVLLWANFDEEVRERRFFTFVYLLSLGPTFIGVMGGQNNAFSLLLLALSAYLLSKDTQKWQFLAGLVAGIWFFKPQFGAAFGAIGSLLYGKRFVFGFSVVAITFYCLGALVLGGNWPGVWLSAVVEFSREEFSVNGWQLISINDAWKAINENPSGILGAPLLQLATFVLALALFVWSALKFYAASKTQSFLKLHRLIFFTIAMLLFAPHVLFYEFGLAVLPTMSAFFRRGERGIWELLMLNVVVSLFTALRAYGGAYCLTPIAAYLSLVYAQNFCSISDKK